MQLKWAHPASNSFDNQSPGKVFLYPSKDVCKAKRQTKPAGRLLQNKGWPVMTSHNSQESSMTSTCYNSHECPQQPRHRQTKSGQRVWFAIGRACWWWCVWEVCMHSVGRGGPQVPRHPTEPTESGVFTIAKTSHRIGSVHNSPSYPTESESVHKCQDIPQNRECPQSPIHPTEPAGSGVFTIAKTSHRIGSVHKCQDIPQNWVCP